MFVLCILIGFVVGIVFASFINADLLENTRLHILNWYFTAQHLLLVAKVTVQDIIVAVKDKLKL